jgi:hypothetical protein
MSERKVITRADLAHMWPEAKDKLPGPAELQDYDPTKPSARMRWVGIGWVNEGPADGTEPLLILNERPA